MNSGKKDKWVFNENFYFNYPQNNIILYKNIKF